MARAVRVRMKRERNNEGAKAQMGSLMLSHWEDAPREQERKDSLAEETAGLVFEQLSPLCSHLCLQREESG